jgi:hypothetical protein
MVELRAPAPPGIDAVEAVLMQTLLNDFRTAVAGLRNVTQHTEQRLSGVAATLKQGRRLLPSPVESSHPGAGSGRK